MLNRDRARYAATAIQKSRTNQVAVSWFWQILFQRMWGRKRSAPTITAQWTIAWTSLLIPRHRVSPTHIHTHNPNLPTSEAIIVRKNQEGNTRIFVVLLVLRRADKELTVASAKKSKRNTHCVKNEGSLHEQLCERNNLGIDLYSLWMNKHFISKKFCCSTEFIHVVWNKITFPIIKFTVIWKKYFHSFNKRFYL